MLASNIFFYRRTDHHIVIYKHPLLSDPIPTNLKASNSVLLSLGDFILAAFPRLAPPHLQSLFEHPETVYPSVAWSQELSQCVLKRQAIRTKNILYLRCDVDLAYQGQLLNLGFTKEQYSEFKWAYCDIQIKDSELFNSSDHIALLNCSNSTHIYNRPKIDLKALYLGIFFNNQRWTSYNVLEGQLPSIEEIKTANTIIVPGSNISVNDCRPQIESLKMILKQAMVFNPTLKYIGVCFGMQFLAHLYNGKVQKSKQRVWKVENITINDAKLNSVPYLSDLGEYRNIRLSEYHCEEVVEIPHQFDLVASSKSCHNEVILSKNKRMVGFQGHPDYTVEFMAEYESRRHQFDGSTYNHSETAQHKDEHTPFRNAIIKLMEIS